MSDFILENIIPSVSGRPKNILNQIFSFDIQKFENLLRTKDENFWNELGRRRALKLFKAAARRVPAYANFLKKYKVRPELVKTIDDFSNLPFTDKKNYIEQYPLSERCWDGKLLQSKLLAASSGTSGGPTLWPRGKYQEFEAAIIHELIYRYLFDIQRYSTLLIVGFPMGVYVSGVATLIPSMLTAVKGYPLTIVSTGNDKAEVLKVLKAGGKNFEMVILAGHPLFIKDVIESGSQEGILWKNKRIRIMFCSEEFSEEWRDYILKKVGGFKKPHLIISTYGSSELLLIAHETPLSIAVRRILSKNLNLLQNLVGDKSIPNLFQYNPLLRFVETQQHELIFTSPGGIPLIRYNLHDRGEIIPLARALSGLQKYKISNNQKLFWNLPFLALWGRSEYKVVFYAANIYPENIRSALSRSSFFPKLTGRFTLRKDYLKNMDEFLEINIELRKGVKPSRQLIFTTRDEIVLHLQKVNMEYLFIYKHNPTKDLRPRIKFWSYQHEKYFKPGLKPRYIIEG